MPSTSAASLRQWTEKEIEDEYLYCCCGPDAKIAGKPNLKGYFYWLANYCWIEDKETHRAILFDPYGCQREIAELMGSGFWLWILKARRLGVTWLVLSYIVWLVQFNENRTAAIINQADEYAQDNLDRCRFIMAHQPDWMQLKADTDHKRRVTLSNGGEIRSFAPSKLSMRSIAADFIFADEGAYIQLLKECLGAAEPTVETAKGQVVVASTSNGPSGKFYDDYQASAEGSTKYKALFYGWRERPGRTDEWYEAEKKAHAHDPLYMKREYPATPEEAFESAEGRVYPLFVRNDKCIREIEVHPDWPKYRGIDFGGADPFVCLWGCIVKGNGPALTVDKSCTNLIRELLAYSWSTTGDYPEDAQNHANDCLRYIVTTFDVRGHLHIYRELYEPDSASRGLSLPVLAERIKHYSEGEEYAGSVADRSRPDSILELRNLGIPCTGQKHLSGGQKPEIVQGIVKVNSLVVGTEAINYPDMRKRAMPVRLPGVRFG